MAAFFNLTLDTVAPSGITLKINGGASRTGSLPVTLAIGCSDSDKTGYQMKIYGDVNGGLTESAAEWQEFAAAPTGYSLTSGDGTKTIKVKVRDRVLNESAETSAAITLDTTNASVTISAGPDKTEISEVDGANVATFSFTANEPFEQYKVCVVSATTDTQDKGTVIGTTNGSTNTSGTGNYSADTPIEVKINAKDYRAALGVGTGAVTKLGIVKVFVYDGIQWSE